MKLVHNGVSLGTVALMAEAATCAARNGVAPEVFVDVLAVGGGGDTALVRLKLSLLAQDANGLRFGGRPGPAAGLNRCTASPLHRFTASPLHRFTAAPLHRCTAAPLHR